MPDSLGPTGLTTATLSELEATLTAAFETIYGSDVNLDPNSPDGQIIAIFSQAGVDVRELLTQVFNSFDPDNAVGTVLDERCAINGIQRQAGTFTTTNVTITINQALTLYGLDQSNFGPYTVADAAGNQWFLQETQTPSASGSYVYLFQSSVPGAILSVPNTITIPVTVVLGVTAINNPTTYATLGINEESDGAFKIRRQKSVALSSQGYFNSLLAALENVNGVSSVFLYENDTGSTDGNGVPGHSIWVIANGSFMPANLAQAIYTKRNAGCGMKGSQTFSILQADGSLFVVRWDLVTPENLFIKFTATSIDGINNPRYADIISGLVTSFVPNVAQEVNINDLATAAHAIDTNALITNAGFSTTYNGSYTDLLTTTALNYQFVVSAMDIIILPILVTPSSLTIAALGMHTFSAVGGYSTYTWSLHTNASGGSIVSGTGAYTAGSTPGTDVVRVTDSDSNFTDVSVVVT
jgi:uncharacterized phage protein gp47/JayE